jgi:hypothetical protein
MKVTILLGLAIMFLTASLLFALFMNVFTPGNVADAQANVNSSLSNGSSSYSILPINASMIEAYRSAVSDTSGEANSTKDDRLEIPEYGNDDKRSILKYIDNFTTRLRSATPTPVPVSVPMIAPKLPLEVLWDQPFYESIKPIQDYDRKKLIVDDTSYRFDSGPLLLDPAGTYGGSVYAYPGDTIGIRLRIYNNGKLLSTVARVDITLLKMNDTNNNVFTDTGVDLHYDMDVESEESTGMEKSILINVPENNSDSAGSYKLTVKLYVNDTLSSDMSKEFNVL